MLRGEEEWRSAKSLGTHLGTDTDLQRRKTAAAKAFGRLNRLWYRRHIVSEKRRLRMYNAYVPPVLRYNLHTAALTSLQAESLNAFHRKQLRRVIGVTYPDIISNKDLYLRTGTKPLSETLFEARWTQFRKVLQLPRDTPAFQAMHIYLRLDSARPGRAHIPVLKKRSGVAPTNLVTLLRSELAKA